MDLPEPFSPAPLLAADLTPGRRTSASVHNSSSPTRVPFVLPIAILVVLIVSFQQVSQPDLAAVYRDPLIRLFTLAAVLIALGLFALHRYQIVLPSALLGLEMGFEVIVAFAIALVETVVPLSPDRPVLGISAVGPWILLISVLVRNRPIWTLVTAVAAASMWPIAYWVNLQRHGLAPAPWGRLIVWPGINYLIAVLAALISRRMSADPRRGRVGATWAAIVCSPRSATGGMGEVWKASHEMLARQAAIKLVRPRTAACRPSRPTCGSSGSGAKPTSSPGCSRRTPSTSTISASRATGSSTTSWSCSTASACRRSSRRSVRSRPGACRRSAQICALARGSAPAEPGAPRSQAVERDALQARADLRLRQGARFRPGQVRGLRGIVQLTMEGTTAGTPGYIAPEVALGEDRVDGRADIYALGCVAYFLLTGTLVFPDSNPMTMALKHVQARAGSAVGAHPTGDSRRSRAHRDELSGRRPSN